jgi:transposase
VARRRMGMADIKEILVGWDVGESVSAIGRRLGYTRVTVRKYVQAAEQVGLRRGVGRRQEAEWGRLAQAAIAQVAKPRARGPASGEVAHYHAYLEPRIGTAPLTVLHQRLRDEQGLQASWRTFHRSVRAQWPERLRPVPRTTIRLDDPSPGEEAQVDFFYVGYWPDPATGRRRKLYALLMTLSQSRHQFLYPCVAEDSTAWLEGHVAALHFFGGAPRRVVPDNLTAGILKADRYDPRLNRAYGELARHYGFLVDPTRVQHPQDKAKVERGVPYARARFFAGRSWDSLGAMRADARAWCLQTAGKRRHGTTGEQPLLAFEQREQAALQPLPPQPWERASWTSAAVHSDCHVRAGHAWYSVPYRYVGQRLDVRLGERLVTIYDGVSLVATRLRRSHGRATQLEHYPPAGQAYLRATPQACLEQAQQLGAATGALVQTLLEPYTLTRLREVQAVLRLREHYAEDRIERACQRAMQAGDGRYRTVRGILERALDTLEPELLCEPRASRAPAAAFLRGPAAFAVVGLVCMNRAHPEAEKKEKEKEKEEKEKEEKEKDGAADEVMACSR